MLRPFLEQRLYQTSTPAKLAEYWQAQVSTRGNDLSERVILAENALPATPSEPVSRSHIAPADGTKPQKAGWHGLRRRPTGRGRPRRPGNPASNHPAANPPPRPDLHAAKSDAGTLPLRQQPAPRHPAPSAFSRRPTRRHAANPPHVRHPRCQIRCRPAVKKTAPPDGGALIISQ